MSISGNLLRKILSIVLVIAILLTTVGCSGSPPNPVLSDPNRETLVENTQTENIITETVFTEFITEEVYLEELILVENQIAEMLLEENTIDEVILCKTIFVPQNNIDECRKRNAVWKRSAGAWTRLTASLPGSTRTTSPAS